MHTLTVNYRSHEAIISVPSKLFYAGQLKVFDEDDHKSLCDWNVLPKEGFPILWHHVTGHESLEPNGNSFKNQVELALVGGYINQLRHDKNLEFRDIGVISPYKYQVF